MHVGAFSSRRAHPLSHRLRRARRPPLPGARGTLEKRHGWIPKFRARGRRNRAQSFRYERRIPLYLFHSLITAAISLFLSCRGVQKILSDYIIIFGVI